MLVSIKSQTQKQERKDRNMMSNSSKAFPFYSFTSFSSVTRTTLKSPDDKPGQASIERLRRICKIQLRRSQTVAVPLTTCPLLGICKQQAGQKMIRQGSRCCVTSCLVDGILPHFQERMWEALVHVLSGGFQEQHLCPP